MIFPYLLQKSSPRKRSDPRGSAFEDGSDESETSSINSEKSFDYGRRTSDVSMPHDMLTITKNKCGTPT